MREPPPAGDARIAVALFDFGGVIFDFDPSGRLTTLAADCGRTEADVRALVWESGLTNALDVGRYTTMEWFELVRETLGLRMGFERFCDVYLSAIRPRPAMLSLVDEIRPPVRKAVLTDNTEMLLGSMALRFPEVHRRFDPLLFSSTLRALKPSREAFSRALDALGVPAAAVFFTDDTLANVTAARALGIDAVQFTDIDELRADLARRDLLAPARTA